MSKELKEQEMQLETRVRRRARREKIQENITLLLFRLTTQSGRLAFAPEAVLIKRLGLRGARAGDASYRIRQAVRRLKEKGLVSFEQGKRGWSVRLNPAGVRLGERLDTAERIQIQRPPRWDGRWRIVIFDIWERRRKVRDKLRILLRKAGFYKIQDSVWVHPYDCAELVAFMRAEMRLGQGIVYIIAEGIENDSNIRRHFDLP